MKHIARATLFLIALSPALILAQTTVVACDLIDQQAVSKVLLSSIKQHSPNRQVQQMGGAAFSSCIFFAERGQLKSQLFEYPSAADAAKAFKQMAAPSPDLSVKSESGIGDEAVWWSLGTEAHGLTARKGKRVLVVDTRWSDGAQSSDVKARVKSTVQVMVGRL